MNLQHLLNKQQKEWDEFMEGYKETQANLYKEKEEIYAAFKGQEIPVSIQNIMDCNHKLWQKEWGIDGNRSMQLAARHKKEIESFFQRKNIVRGLKENEKDKENQKGKDGGR